MTKMKNTKKSMPAAKKVSAAKMSIAKKAPAAKKVSTAKKAPATKKAPTAKKVPATKKAPTAKKAPATKKVPTAKKAPASKKPTAKKVPTSKKPAVKKAPTLKKPAVKKASATKKAPTPKKATTQAALIPHMTNHPATETELRQHFIQSLEQLEKYWHNKVDSLKKQAEHSKLFPESANIHTIRDSLDEAINEANKYSALQDMIMEFEQDWTRQIILTNAAKSVKADKKTKTELATITIPLAEASTNLATKMDEIHLEEETLLEDLDDELVSDDDDEAASELEFADDSAAFFPDDDLFDQDSEDYAN